MDQRLARGLHIAATTLLDMDDKGRWRVPSQTGTGTYRVAVTADGSWICNCPDWEERLDRCKHVHAVETQCQRESRRKPTPYTPVEKVTYTQDWPAYNKAQCNEKAMILNLLRDLCSNVEQPVQVGAGQRLLPLADVTFLMVLRTYSRLSARRFDTDARDMVDRGYIDAAASYNSLIRYTANPDLTPILTGLVELSALPLAAIETDFAADSSGFGTSNLRTWFSTKHGKVMEKREWRKCHLMCGVNTNIVTAVEVSGPDDNDSPFLPELARTTAKGFTVREVSADKGYLARSNADAIEAVGGTPFISFKHNTVEPKPGTAWARMYHRFAADRDDYLARYHKRSNVETVFSMIKRKFGDTLAGKTTAAQDNEVLCKVIAHNLCCLVHAHHELGIESAFATRWASDMATATESTHPFEAVDFDDVSYEARHVLTDTDGVVERLLRSILELSAAVHDHGVELGAAVPIGPPRIMHVDGPVYEEAATVRECAEATQEWLRRERDSRRARLKGTR